MLCLRLQQDGELIKNGDEMANVVVSRCAVALVSVDTNQVNLCSVNRVTIERACNLKSPFLS